MRPLREMFLSHGVLPHGFCYQWNPVLIWLHAVSDTLIAIAYFSIPIVLLRFVRKRQDLPFIWMFVSFAVFIAACGATHLMDVWTLWIPSYWWSAGVKVVTALASVPTAIFLIQLVPRALKIPSVEEMKAANEELRRQDRVLRASEERFRQMADNIQEIFWMLNAQTLEIVYVNRAFELICERPVESLYLNPTSYRELIHSGDRQRVLAALEALEGTNSFEEEFRITCPGGGVKWIRAIGFTARSQAGSVRTLVGTAQEITARKEAENKLRDSEDRYRDLVEHSTDLICTHSLDGFLLSVNELPVKLLGFSREELLNKPMQDFIVPEGREEFNEYLRNIAISGSAKGLMVVIAKSGERRIWEYKNTLRTDGVSVPIVRGIAHDITEIKQAEKELQSLPGRLLRLQDEERRKIARDLHDSTGQDLVALGTILSQLRESIPAAKRTWQKSVSQCQSIADRTLREVRTLSYVLHPPMLDEAGLEDAIREFADGFEPRTGIELSLDISDNFGRLPRDTEIGLFRVIQESLINIQRHSGSRSAQIKMMRDAKKILLEVSDQGHGICPAELRKKVTSGCYAGVGLPSMEERVKQVGGKLAIESSQRGTSVHVTVPIHG